MSKFVVIGNPWKILDQGNLAKERLIAYLQKKQQALIKYDTLNAATEAVPQTVSFGFIVEYNENKNLEDKQNNIRIHAIKPDEKQTIYSTQLQLIHDAQLAAINSIRTQLNIEAVKQRRILNFSFLPKPQTAKLLLEATHLFSNYKKHSIAGLKNKAQQLIDKAEEYQEKLQAIKAKNDVIHLKISALTTLQASLLTVIDRLNTIPNTLKQRRFYLVMQQYYQHDKNKSQIEKSVGRSATKALMKETLSLFKNLDTTSLIATRSKAFELAIKLHEHIKKICKATFPQNNKELRKRRERKVFAMKTAFNAVVDLATQLTTEADKDQLNRLLNPFNETPVTDKLYGPFWVQLGAQLQPHNSTVLTNQSEITFTDNSVTNNNVFNDCKEVLSSLRKGLTS